MNLYTEEDLIDLVEKIKDYTRESHIIIGHDERTSKEFVTTFLEDRKSDKVQSWSGKSSVALPSTSPNVCGQNNTMPRSTITSTNEDERYKIEGSLSTIGVGHLTIEGRKEE